MSSNKASRRACSAQEIWSRSIARVSVGLIVFFIQPSVPIGSAAVTPQRPIPPRFAHPELKHELTIEVTTTPITDAPAEGQFTAARAISVARERVQGQEAVASPEARLVRLTTRRRMDGTMLITDRRVWLVTFPGVTFTAAPCACSGDAPPPLTAPTTAIAIDPADGEVVTKIGLS